MKGVRAYLAVPLIRQAVLLTLFAAALLTATEMWFWAPGRAQHAAIKAEVVDLQARKVTLEARLDAVEDHDRTASLLEVLDTRLSAEVDRSTVVERLTDISAQAGTRIIHGANSFGTPRGGVRPLLQDLTVEGSYAQIAGFLNALADVQTLTLLRSAEFSANPDGSLVRVQMKLVTLSTGADE